MRVHVVHANNRALYRDEIEAMHRHRYQLFVLERGWRALESSDGLDIDEFDNADATYLVGIDNDGRVAGSGRFIPSWRPNLLSTLFPEYCLNGVPVGPGVWEWTRHATPGRSRSKEENLQFQILMNLAVLEFAQTRGITSFIGILETSLLPHTIDLGWKSLPIGAPRAYGEGTAVAIQSEVRRGHLQQLRARTGINDAILVEVPGFVGQRGRVVREWLELASRLSEPDLRSAADIFAACFRQRATL